MLLQLSLAYISCFLILKASSVEGSDSKVSFERSEGIYQLTEGNHDAALETFEHVMIYYYAPWCGHCKALEPEYVKAGQILREREVLNVKLAKVDGTEEKDLVKKEDVTEYPTIRFYRKGSLESEPNTKKEKRSFIKFTGGRTAPEIADWIERKIAPPAKILSDLAAVEAFIEDKEVSVVGFFPKADENKEIKKKKAEYISACLDYDDEEVHYPVGITDDPEAASRFKAEPEGQIIMFKKFDDRRAYFKGDYGVESIRNFISEEALPTVVEFNPENAKRMFRQPNDGKSHLLVFHSKTSDTFQDETSMLSKVGKNFRDSVVFVSVDVEEEDNKRMLEFLGVRHRINNDTFPSMRIVKIESGGTPIRYKPEEMQVTEENVRSFVTSYLAGKISRHYFVEPLPKDWNDKPVKYLTAANFKEIVEDKTKNAVVMHYAPWCGHCKVLHPVWDSLAENYKSNDEYVFGKIDSTVNELEGYKSLNSFPTIVLYRKDGTQAEYNGERTVEGISKFLRTDGVYGMAAPDHDEL